METVLLELRANFDNREAIYIEKGALRVRVSNINIRHSAFFVSASVEEIPTPGLGVGLFATLKRKGKAPLRWNIGTRFETSSTSIYFDHFWSSGAYGGWSLHFDAKIIKDVLWLASRLPDDMDWLERYLRIARVVQHYSNYRQAN